MQHHERQFERMKHGQVVKIKATIQSNSASDATVLRLHAGKVGPGKTRVDDNDKYQFVVEFVEASPEEYPVVEDGKYPDHIRLRIKGTEPKQYLCFKSDGAMGLTVDSTQMDTEMYVYPLKFKGQFKFESVKFPSSMMQCGYKDGCVLAHGVDEFGGNCSVFNSDSLFGSINEKIEQLYDPTVKPCPNPVKLPLAQRGEFQSMDCVGYKKVRNSNGSFNHAAYQFRVTDTKGCSWYVWHRFSAGLQFHKDLASEMKMQGFPTPPEKGSMFKAEDNDKLLTDRQQSFSTYFTAVCQTTMPHLASTQTLKKFIKKTGPKEVAVSSGGQNADGISKQTDNKGKFKHATYCLRVCYTEFSWTVNKRYSDLATAVSALKLEFSDIPEIVAALETFPSKVNKMPQGFKLPKQIASFFGLKDHKDDEFLLDRARKLDAFFNSIAGFPQIGRSRSYLQFLAC